jgi:hypothetical protein
VYVLIRGRKQIYMICGTDHRFGQEYKHALGLRHGLRCIYAKAEVSTYAGMLATVMSPTSLMTNAASPPPPTTRNFCHFPPNYTDWRRLYSLHSPRNHHEKLKLHSGVTFQLSSLKIHSDGNNLNNAVKKKVAQIHQSILHYLLLARSVSVTWRI